MAALTSCSPSPAGSTPSASSCLRPQRAHGRARGDLGIQLRLGESRFVALVVAPAPVADQVDQEILSELLPVGDRHVRHRQAGLGIVAIDVHDRDLEALGQVAGVECRARVLRIGREADLVVDDDVQRAAGGEAGQVGEVQRLGHDALAGEGRVAVQHDRPAPSRGLALAGPPG